MRLKDDICTYKMYTLHEFTSVLSKLIAKAALATIGHNLIRKYSDILMCFMHREKRIIFKISDSSHHTVWHPFHIWFLSHVFSLKNIVRITDRYISLFSYFLFSIILLFDIMQTFHHWCHLPLIKGTFQTFHYCYNFIKH